MQNQVDSLGRYLVEHSGKAVSLAQGKAMAQGNIYSQFLRQCSMLAYLDVIKVLAVLMVVLIPLVFFMKRPPKGRGGPVGH